VETPVIDENICTCKACGKGVLVKEDRKKQYDRIKVGISNLFGVSDKLDEYTKNYIGYGPNYMHECTSCGILKKIIPDGRDRE
jgi:hypothetical protein